MSYAENQAAFLIKNNIQIGDKVKVLRMADKEELNEFFNGFTISSSPVIGMIKESCGKIFEVRTTYPAGISLFNPDIKTFYVFPYHILERVGKKRRYFPIQIRMGNRL